MRKFLFVILISLILTGCSIPFNSETDTKDLEESFFLKKMECLNAKENIMTNVSTYLVNNYYNRTHTYQEVFYSPQLDTCVFALAFEYGNPSKIYYILFDGLTGEVLFNHNQNKGGFELDIINLK